MVGKAVTLADMIAAEFLVVFHETASGYTSATQAMNAHLASHGLPQTLAPYRPADLSDLGCAWPPPRRDDYFRLPPHLAATFGT